MRGCVMEKYNEFLKLRMNFDLFTNKNEISRSLSLLDQKLDPIKNSNVLFYRKETFSRKNTSIKVCYFRFRMQPHKSNGHSNRGSHF